MRCFARSGGSNSFTACAIVPFVSKCGAFGKRRGRRGVFGAPARRPTGSVTTVVFLRRVGFCCGAPGASFALLDLWLLRLRRLGRRRPDRRQERAARGVRSILASCAWRK